MKVINAPKNHLIGLKKCFTKKGSNIIFIHISKNASTSIKTSLGLNKYIDFDSDNLDKHIKIIILRDPFKRIVSGYFEILKLRKDGHHNITRNQEFYKEYLKGNIVKSFSIFVDEIKNNAYDGHIFPQIWSLKEKNLDIKDVDVVLFVETLEKDLKKICKKYNWKFNMKIKNKNNKKPEYSKLITYVNENNEIRTKIKNLYKEDFELYETQKSIHKDIV